MKLLSPDKSRLAKAAAALAVVLLVSLGLCGANLLLAPHADNQWNGWIVVSALVEAAGIFVGAFGLISVLLAMLVKSVIEYFRKDD